MRRNTFGALALTLIIFSTPAHSALITSLSNLNIGGTLYNVTFNNTNTFNEIFDVDSDGIFGEGDGSLIDRAPTFLFNASLAEDAANAVITALGTIDHTSTAPGLLLDGFVIPFDLNIFNPQNDSYLGFQDANVFSTSDDSVRRQFFRTDSALNLLPIATFDLASPSAVSTPPTLALASLALALMGFLGRCLRVS